MADKITSIRALWQQAAEQAIQFREHLDEGVQRPIHSYQQAAEAFRAPTPEVGTEGAQVVAELAELASPGIHAMPGARFFGWVIGASHEVGVAADWLTASWGQNAGNHMAAPAAAAAELIASQWLLDILDLPSEASVGYVTGCTMANFVCLAAARSEVLRKLGWDVEAKGLFGAPPIRVVLGEDAHSTVYSALQYLGFGTERVTRVPTDNQGAMLPDSFEQIIADAAADPAVIVIAQAGQINTGVFDPLVSIVAATRNHANCWVHVDGAFGLWARACPDRAHLAAGVAEADSWATDGHKWLQTPYDCGYAIVKNAEAHRRAMNIAASYLPPTTEGERDPSQYVPELSRRARGFATWAMLKHLGRQGIAEMVERHCRLARLIAGELSQVPGIEIMNDVVLNQVAVRFGADKPVETGDELTLKVISAVQREGTCFAAGARWKGRWIMRISVIGYPCQEVDVLRSAESIARLAKGIISGE